MLRLTELKLPLDHPSEALRAAILKRLELADDELVGFSIFKRSYDARKKHALLMIYAVDVEGSNEAALLRAQMVFKPIVRERGKAVRERTQDTWGLWRKHVLNPESNVQFGEGGAGTFSAGKRYSQFKDPQHLARRVLPEFV